MIVGTFHFQTDGFPARVLELLKNITVLKASPKDCYNGAFINVHRLMKIGSVQIVCYDIVVGNALKDVGCSEYDVPFEI